MSGAWANDPWGRFLFRWHDGTTWSEHVSDGSHNGFDPPGTAASVGITPPEVVSRPSGDELIERLVQTAREAIDARAPMSRSTAPPPTPTPDPAPTTPPTATVRPPAVPAPPTTTAPAVSAVQPTMVSAPASAASSGRTRPPWGWIVAGVAVPVALWCLYNARDNDESVASGDAPIEFAASTTTTTTTDAPPVGTVAVASVAPGVTTTLPPPTPDPTLIERCVEFAPFAAYIGDPEMIAFWTATGSDVGTLRSNCAALAPEELDRLSRRKTEMDLFMNGGVVTTLATVPAVPTSVAPPP